MNTQDIKNLTLAELKQAIAAMHEPGYRAEQIFSWLYQKAASDFNQMSNISEVLREKLRKTYYIGRLQLEEHLTSADGAEKFLFKLSDDNFIETVLIHAKQRKTICLSSQVGCKFGCPACASGAGGFRRD
ncbi:MAG: 23S rRNA (adenine(2503)-C(2))-methyltransferase RlmN, partial [Candidatus Omnitrophica bacterium]|nr:23S rRNA (adenine(2503)-C(2))-methyltransferase RlmN [Candidatus Omnitrophota bacterium]